MKTVQTNAMYSFRFMPSNKFISLNQQQLNHIGYLSAIVEHKDDFLSCQNENNEFILNPPIHYTWFVPILHSINSKQPYSLFTELPEDENILDTLQLFDYLGIKSYSLPSLRHTYLVLSNPINNETEERIIGYDRANLSEARNTAAQFIIAIYKNEYDLLDNSTMMNVFSLIMDIITQPDIFSSRFRHHTVTIVQEHCFSFFDTKQKRGIIFTHNKVQKQRNLNSLKYLYDENGSLPEDFDSPFVWKSDSELTEKNSDRVYMRRIDFIYRRPMGKSYIIRHLFGIDMELEDPSTNVVEIRSFPVSDFLEWFTRRKYTIKQTHVYQDIHKRQNTEAKSARSGYFNKLPKRPKIDKFKHRCGPKAQKHR